MFNHRKAIEILVIAGLLDIMSGAVFAGWEHHSLALGLYWAVTTATTVGYGDVVPHTIGGHVIAVMVMLTVVPLFAATFSLFTSSLTAQHIHAEGSEMRRRLDHIIRHHPQIPDLPQPYSEK